MTCAVSSSASWLAFATPTTLRVYRCDIATNARTPTLSRIKTSSITEPIHHLAFFTGRLGDSSNKTTGDSDKVAALLENISAYHKPANILSFFKIKKMCFL